MTFEEWDDKHWTVKCRDNKHYELEAPGCTYVFNKHDFLQLFRNINAVADNLFGKEVYYIHDDGIYNRETGEQLLGVIDDCEKLNEQDTKIKDLIKENEQLKKENEYLKSRLKKFKLLGVVENTLIYSVTK